MSEDEKTSQRTLAPLLLIVLAIVDVAFVWANYQAFAPCDGHATLGFIRMLWGIGLMCFGLLVMLAVVRYVVGALTGDNGWRPAIEYIVLGVATSVAIFGGMVVADIAIDVQLEKFIDRTEPLVTAIEDHVEAEGAPPAALEEVAPRFIEAVPDHQVCASTGYDYRVDDEGNWQLRLPIDVDFIEPVYLLYRPDHDYSMVPVMHRLGEWAYVHE